MPKRAAELTDENTCVAISPYLHSHDVLSSRWLDSLESCVRVLREARIEYRNAREVRMRSDEVLKIAQREAEASLFAYV